MFVNMFICFFFFIKTLSASCGSNARVVFFTDAQMALMIALHNDARNSLANGTLIGANGPFQTAAALPVVVCKHFILFIFVRI